MICKKIIYLFLLLLNLEYTNLVFAFSTTQTNNAIIGSPPEVTEQVSPSRLFLKVQEKEGSHILSQDEDLNIIAPLNSTDFLPVIIPPLQASDYYDRDGDSGRVIEKRLAIEWLDNDLNVITVPDNYPINKLVPVPKKMRLIGEVEAQSDFGLPQKNSQPVRIESIKNVTISPNLLLSSSSLGTYDHPAANCLEIYNTNNSSPDGEYWVGGKKNRVKTFCDMRNGGFTLIWSYSEKTAFSIYDKVGEFSQYKKGYNFSDNVPRNLVTSLNHNINYKDYRLDMMKMMQVRSAVPAEYRVRIAYNPTDTDDPWGNDNYFDAKPTDADYDYIGGSMKYKDITMPPKGHGVVTLGKLFGLDYSSDKNNNLYNNVKTGTVFAHTNRGNWPAHWNAGHLLAKLSDRYSVSIPLINGMRVTDTIRPYYINNIFGYHGEREINHHFGKCQKMEGKGKTKKLIGDDYSFTIDSCLNATRIPHSFNDGEGRYLQWYVK